MIVADIIQILVYYIDVMFILKVIVNYIFPKIIIKESIIGFQLSLEFNMYKKFYLPLQPWGTFMHVCACAHVLVYAVMHVCVSNGPISLNSPKSLSDLRCKNIRFKMMLHFYRMIPLGLYFSLNMNHSILELNI